jgi:hypothetical protein
MERRFYPAVREAPSPVAANSATTTGSEDEVAIEKPRPSHRGFAASPRFVYLPAVASCEEMLVKVLFNCEPSVLTTVMMATEIPAAIKPYSIAVAPDSSFAKRFTKLVIVGSSSICCLRSGRCRCLFVARSSEPDDTLSGGHCRYVNKIEESRVTFRQSLLVNHRLL